MNGLVAMGGKYRPECWCEIIRTDFNKITLEKV